MTIVDVAQDAGVSPETVSRVLNGKGPVRAETAARVREAIERLGYRRNAVARSLVQQRTHVLGVLVPDIANPFFPEVVRGIEQEAQQHGYHIVLCNTAETPEIEARSLVLLAERRVDAVILCSARMDSATLLQLGREFPAVVLVNRSLQASFLRSVCVDDELGMALVLHHLLATGRRRIAFIGGPTQSYSSQARERSFIHVLVAIGVPREEIIVRHSFPTAEGGKHVASELFREHPDIDAVIGFNDLVAIGILQACRATGRRVPDDVAVVGFDDIPLAELVTPALTTVHVPKQDLGRQAAELALALLDGRSHSGGEELPTDIVLPPRLVIRESSCRLATSSCLSPEGNRTEERSGTNDTDERRVPHTSETER